MDGNNLLKINMLGEFSMEYRSIIINDNASRSKKLWMLLEYLVTFRGNGVSQAELIDLLWSDEEGGDPANALKAIVHRTRELIGKLGLDGKKLITYHRGTYSWTPDGLTVVIDVDRFEQLLSKAELTDDDEVRLKYLLDALALYKGSFLPQTALERWAVPISAYYHTKFVDAAKRAVDLLAEVGRFSEVVDLCRRASVIDPYDESLHMALIRGLFGSGQAQAALAHYEYATDLFFTHFGVNPSPEFVALYKEITKTTHSVEQDIGVIKGRMQEKGSRTGPFYCEFEVFKDVYRLELRAQARTGQIVCLCLLTVASADGSRPSQKQLAASMDKLFQATVHTLRQNDIFTRFSISQYLIMLPGATVENADMAIGRIIRSFRRENPRLATMVRYRLQPLNPVEELAELESSS